MAGKISDERFSKMTKQYEDEQSGLAGRMKILRDELDKESRRTVGTDMFIATVRKYTRARKLTPRMLNELIDHIKLPDILPCEKRVLNQSLFSPSEISQMFGQVSWLVDKGEICRAKDVINRWLGELTPSTLISKLAENAGHKLDYNYVNQDNIKALIEEWGDISYRLHLISFKSTQDELNNGNVLPLQGFFDEKVLDNLSLAKRQNPSLFPAAQEWPRSIFRSFVT